MIIILICYRNSESQREKYDWNDKVRYVSVWKLRGGSKLVTDKNSLLLARLNDPRIEAHVTTDPEPYFRHIDQSAAIGALFLKGLFAENKKGSIQERIAAEIEVIKNGRKERTSAGVFLVLESIKNIPTPDFKIRRDTSEFAVCFDAVDKDEIRESFRPTLDALLVALTLNLPSNADQLVEKTGEVIYLVDPAKETPVYSYTAKFGPARLSLAAQMTEDMITNAAKLVPTITGDKSIARTVSLLISSLNRGTDGLQTFVAAWTALEIFVNATFKARYEAEWFGIMKTGAPAAALPVFERLKNVMSDKYRLSDKFLIIASVLDDVGAPADAIKFGELKEIRDKLLHALETPQNLPTDAVQSMLVKYLKLHCTRTNGRPISTPST